VSPSVSPARTAISVVVDAVCVIAFVILGRSSHDEGGSFVAETAKVAAPFLIALAVGWIISRGWRAPTSLQTGLPVWLTTVVGGLLLRRFVFDRSTALSFAIVTTIVTLLFLLGWRYLANRVRS